jgi:hypothetical protein
MKVYQKNDRFQKIIPKFVHKLYKDRVVLMIYTNSIQQHGI